MSNIIRRSLAQTFTKYNLLINGFYFIAVLYPIGLIVALFCNPNLNIGWENLAIFAVGSGLFPFVNILAFKSSKHVDAGLFTILSNITPIVTIVAAVLLLNESLSIGQLVGAAIIIASTFIVVAPLFKTHFKVNLPSLYLALISIVLLGLAVVYERWMLTRVDFGAYLVYGWGSSALWLLIANISERKHLKILKDKKTFVPIFSYSLSSALRGICFVGAVKLCGNVSLVSAFASFVTVLVVVSAYFFLKEKDHLWLKIISVIIGVIGLIVLNCA